MKNVYIIILAILILVNIVSFIYGRKVLKKVKDNEKEASEEVYKKGIKYVVFSAILSFLTIIAATIMILLDLL